MTRRQFVATPAAAPNPRPSAYCQFPLCQPSRTSLLSGLRPETTRVWTLATPTLQHLGDTTLLPELFRRHGYFTAHAGKVFHTGPHAEDPELSTDVESDI